MISEDQVKSIKTQLIEQIMSSFPEDRKDFAISQIEGMDAQQLEDFLVKNGLIKQGSSDAHCVFCAIVFGEINSYKITENSKAVAILEINPLSNGHVIIIPKEHITSEKDFPKEVNSLSKKVLGLLKNRLGPQEVKVEASNVMGHEIVNLIPVYEGKPLERRKANPEELTELQTLLTKSAPTKRASVKAEKKEKNVVKKVLEEIETKFFWLPKRIP